MLIWYILLIVMTLLGAFGAFFLKKSANQSKSLFGMLKTYQLYVGGFLYFASAILNIYILHYLDYSVVLPLTAVTYIWTMLIACIWLSEKRSDYKMLGIACIVGGAVLIALPPL